MADIPGVTCNEILDRLTSFDPTLRYRNLPHFGEVGQCPYGVGVAHDQSYDSNGEMAPQGHAP